MGDRRLESVPAQLPSFAAQDQGGAFQMPFDGNFNLPTVGMPPYMQPGMDAQGMPQGESLPLSQQFLAQRASAPEYGRKASSPFVEPEPTGAAWLGPRASQGVCVVVGAQMSLLNNAEQPSSLHSKRRVAAVSL